MTSTVSLMAAPLAKMMDRLSSEFGYVGIQRLWSAVEPESSMVKSLCATKINLSRTSIVDY